MGRVHGSLVKPVFVYMLAFALTASSSAQAQPELQMPPVAVQDAPADPIQSAGTTRDVSPQPSVSPVSTQRVGTKAAIRQPKDTTADFWSHVPPLRFPGRVGYFIVPPDKPGYYSLLFFLLGEPVPNTSVLQLPYAATAGDGFSFYDADYRYLENPRFGQVDLFSPLKRIHPTDDWLFSFGGEERLRFMDENGGYEQITGIVNPETWYRSRVYADMWYRDWFRAYVEMSDARVFNDSLPPLTTDIDHADFLNLFVDAKLFSIAKQPAYVRIGRQELYFNGSQRLVSPSDWSNVRRTFQGVRAFWMGRDWDVDAFWMQPVLIEPTRADPPDHNQNFSGLWVRHRPEKHQNINVYYLDLDNRNLGAATGRDGVAGFFNVSTFGARYSGGFEHFLWDFEGMYQFGTWSNQIISAGAVTTGMGYRFVNVPMNPQFWIFNDWASGSQNPNGNIHGTFNQLFAWGHLYFGYLDLVGRQNIDDVSMQFAFYPAKWILTTVQNHVFHLASARDALYNAAGTPIRSSPTGTAGTYVGDEIDFTTNFHLDLHNDIFVGYSKLFAGEFIHRTAGPQTGPSLFYVQYSFKW